MRITVRCFDNIVRVISQTQSDAVPTMEIHITFGTYSTKIMFHTLWLVYLWNVLMLFHFLLDQQRYQIFLQLSMKSGRPPITDYIEYRKSGITEERLAKFIAGKYFLT